MATMSKPESAVYNALLKLGLKDGEDFIFQSPQGGGRAQLGGAVLDFYLPAYGIGIAVQSTYYHYIDADSRARDAFVNTMMEGWGIRLIYIEEADALANADYFVREALAGREHSKLRG